jgi:Na+-transporting NADH:ubiquinone oxidoreductase subunit NqrB
MADHVQQRCVTYMTRILTFLLGTIVGSLFLASLGAFLFYVSILSWATIVATLVGMILMFTLGIQTGARQNRKPRLGPTGVSVSTPGIEIQAESALR